MNIDAGTFVVALNTNIRLKKVSLSLAHINRWNRLSFLFSNFWISCFLLARCLLNQENSCANEVKEREATKFMFLLQRFCGKGKYKWKVMHKQQHQQQTHDICWVQNVSSLLKYLQANQWAQGLHFHLKGQTHPRGGKKSATLWLERINNNYIFNSNFPGVRSISNSHRVAKFAGFVNLFILFYSQINFFGLNLLLLFSVRLVGWY